MCISCGYILALVYFIRLNLDNYYTQHHRFVFFYFDRVVEFLFGVYFVLSRRQSRLKHEGQRNWEKV